MLEYRRRQAFPNSLKVAGTEKAFRTVATFETIDTGKDQRRRSPRQDDWLNARHKKSFSLNKRPMLYRPIWSEQKYGREVKQVKEILSPLQGTILNVNDLRTETPYSMVYNTTGYLQNKLNLKAEYPHLILIKEGTITRSKEGDALLAVIKYAKLNKSDVSAQITPKNVDAELKNATRDNAIFWNGTAGIHVAIKEIDQVKFDKKMSEFGFGGKGFLETNRDQGLGSWLPWF